MKNAHPDQLWLNFQQAVHGVERSLNNLAAAAAALQEARHEKIVDAAKEIEDLRRRLNSVVRHLARSRGLHWREIWRIVFDRLRARTGFDAVSRGLSSGLRPLDAIEKKGLLPVALKIAAEI